MNPNWIFLKTKQDDWSTQIIDWLTFDGRPLISTILAEAKHQSRTAFSSSPSSSSPKTSYTTIDIGKTRRLILSRYGEGKRIFTPRKEETNLESTSKFWRGRPGFFELFVKQDKALESFIYFTPRPLTLHPASFLPQTQASKVALYKILVPRSGYTISTQKTRRKVTRYHGLLGE